MIRNALGVFLARRVRCLSSSAAAPAAVSAAAAPPPLPSAANVAGAPAAAAARAPRSTAPLPSLELHAVRRELDGSRHSQYARERGLIPGLIYSAASSKGGGVGAGGARAIKVYVKEADLRAEVNRLKTSFLNTLVSLVVDGERYTVLPRDLQLHPFRPKIVCCNWFKYVPGKHPGIKVDIPLAPINEERCLAYKDGGWLLQLVHKLPVYAYGESIPTNLTMDLRGRRIGEKIMASDINLGGSLSLVSFAPALALTHPSSATAVANIHNPPPPHTHTPPPLLSPMRAHATLCSASRPRTLRWQSLWAPVKRPLLPPLLLLLRLQRMRPRRMGRMQPRRMGR
jgi:large subunit ribosomal protein L25